MKVIKVRVVPDVEEDVFRDIRIGADHSLEDLYNFIVQTFGFRGDQLASFYLSNEEWDRGHEIALMDMGGASPEGLPTEMRAAILNNLIVENHQKLILVYDFLKMWCFYVEVIDISEGDDGAPEVVMSFGNAPNEDDKEMPDLLEGIDLGENTDNGTFDDMMEGYEGSSSDDSDFEPEGFENIDDLDI